MQNVKVKKDQLLTALRANKEKHLQIFTEAQLGYRKRVIQELDALLRRAVAGDRVPHHWMLQAPVNQTPEYERAILMLEMSVDDEVTLTANEFQCYVMDRWAWRQKFLQDNAAYSITAAQLSDGESESV